MPCGSDRLAPGGDLPAQKAVQRQDTALELGQISNNDAG